ncbi:MAG: oxidase [bacterium]|nr:oxidase [bacterium]
MTQPKRAIHILPLQTYLGIGSALLILTVVTVWVATIDLGPINLLVAMIIAAAKASLVALFFMHLKYDNKLYAVILLGALLFLAAFVVFTMFDTMDRGIIDGVRAGPINDQAVIYEQSTSGPTLPPAESVRSDTVLHREISPSE